MRKSLVLVVSVFFMVASQAPVHAATVWKTGGTANNFSWLNANAIADAWYGSGCGGPAATGGVKLSGDVLMVRDSCADGHSAFIEWREIDRPNNRWICRNGSGNGTTRSCDFEWPETPGVLIAGVSNGTTVVFRDHGASILVNQ
jgi:hypothetical protein